MESQHFLGQVDAHRTPGDAPTAPDAARRAELIDPSSQFMGEPHSVPVLNRRPEVFSMNIAMVGCKAGVPHTGVLRMLEVQGRSLLHAMTKTGGTDHGAVRTGKTACRDLVPPWMIVGVIQNIRKGCEGEATGLTIRAGLYPFIIL